MDEVFCRSAKKELLKGNRKKALVLALLGGLVLLLFVLALFVGSSGLSFGETFMALFGQGTDAAVRIVTKIRLPRVLAALIAGAGLSVAGLVMQTSLGNEMASPSTLGVSNAAVFGANVSIILFAGGFLDTGNHPADYGTSANPFAVSSFALVFAILSVLLILGLCSFASFSPNAVVLAGIAIGSIWTAATTLLQNGATDVGLSAAVIWTFGDLGRATFTTDAIMGIVVLTGIVFFFLFAWRYNAMLSGEEVAKSLGVRVAPFRLISMLIASLITAVCVSFLGIIGFIGVICPNAMKRLFGNNHRYLIPASLLSGCILLLFADTLSRTIANGVVLPVGAITSLLGAPFFLYLIFSRRGRER